ncbi:olfactory receptor class A-like protein 1 [Protopterus annectens]|uniref:olfactory receptor class A-like protein 1 n=1 Tax=Protopterus annectens TaxID=7888 RepID=UPI001CFB7A06|nr:olfactory receptor class A-like protein 1 [Protopterus annectens]
MEVQSILKTSGFILLETVGIPGNLTVMFTFLIIKLYSNKFMMTDIILTNLAFVNLLAVISRCIPITVTDFEGLTIFNDNSCRLSVYTYRVSRGTSVCLTSLLSCYQFLIITSNSRWVALKQIMARSLCPVILCLWGLNLFLYSWTIPIIFAKLKSNSTEYTLNLKFCFVVFQSYFSYTGNGLLYIVHVFSFVGLMVLASGSIISVLHQHKMQVENIRTSSRNRSMAEIKATKAVLLLVALYVILFGLDNFFWIYSLTIPRAPSIISDARVFYASCYSSLSPVVIISTNKRIRKKLKYAIQSHWSEKNNVSRGN